MPKLLPFFRILRYDTRGLGKSSSPNIPKGDLKLEQLGQDVIAILDKENIEKCYFCGLSMGGLIGQWLAIHHANRLEKLIICNTAAKIGQAETWNERIEYVLQNGTNAIWDATLQRWFTPNFQTQITEYQHIKYVFIDCDRVGYTTNCAAVRDADFRNDLQKITTPTLIIAGEKDPVTTVEDGQFLNKNIPNSELHILEAAHLSSVEKPTEFVLAVLNFAFANKKNSVYDGGMVTRRSVLGDAHVDRAEANKTPFDTDFQSFITKYAWGEIWSRPHLTKRERSMITIAVLATLGHHEEVEMHLRACKNTGATEEDIKEVLLHIAIYAGVPVSNIAYKIAKKVFND